MEKYSADPDGKYAANVGETLKFCEECLESLVEIEKQFSKDRKEIWEYWGISE